MYTVADVMTKDPITVGPDDTLERAETLMRNGPLRHLPVVHHGKLVGLLTQRDILSARARTPAAVREVMVTDVVTGTERMPLRRAARTLYEHRFGCLPILDEKRAVAGILTETDFIRFAAEMVTDFDRIEAAVRKTA